MVKLFLFFGLWVVCALSIELSENPFAGMVIDMSNENICMYSSEEFERKRIIDPVCKVDTNVFQVMQNADISPSVVERNDFSRHHTLYILNDEEEMRAPSKGDLMNSKFNVFYFRNSKNSLYYDDDKETWFQISLKENQKAEVKSFPELIPISPCLDSSEGDGGYITQEYDVQVSVTGSLGFELSLNLSPITLGATLGVSVGNSFTYSGIFECDASKGEYAQMFIEPFFVEVPEGTRRLVVYRRYKGIVVGDDREDFHRYKLIAQHQPNHVCLIGKDPSDLKCGDLEKSKS